MAKKDEYRFTIQFSSTDPRHLQVAEILNRQGRRKAQYITNAVLCYENTAETAAPGQPSLLDHHTIEAIVNHILEEKKEEQNLQTSQPFNQLKEMAHQSEDITFEDAVPELGEDSLSTIADSIAAFRDK